MPVFAFPFRATIRRGTSTTDRFGQDTSEYTDVVLSQKCLYNTVSGNKKLNIGEAYQAVIEFYTPATCPIDEGDIIVNIRDKWGKVIEAGPYEAVSVKQVPSLSGRVHHKSCKLVGTTKGC